MVYNVQYYSIVQSAVNHIAVQFSTVLKSTIEYTVVNYIKYRIEQNSTGQYSTV